MREHRGRLRLGVLLTLAASAVIGLVVGLLLSNETRTGQAGTDGRHLAATVEYLDAGGAVVHTELVEIWLSADGARSRAEVRDQAGKVLTVEVRDGRTLRRLKWTDGTPVYNQSTRLPERMPFERGYEAAVLGAAERVRLGKTTVLGRSVVDGRQVVSARAEFPGAAGEEVAATEEQFDQTNGRLLERRFFTRSATGVQQLSSVQRFRYTTDATEPISPTKFELQPPVDALVYIDAELSPAEVQGFNAFRLYGLGPQFGRYRQYLVTESLSQGAAPNRGHLVSFSYLAPDGAAITVSNLPAAEIAGKPRCEAPKPVAPGSLGDVVREGNAACGYGVEVSTSLGTEVLRSDQPTIEIQLGPTVVFVHANTADEAKAAAAQLAPAN